MAKPAFLFRTYSNTVTTSASSTATGYDPDEVLIATEDTKWKPSTYTGSPYIDIDQGSGQAFEAIGILGAELNGVTIEVLSDSSVIPVDDTGITSLGSFTVSDSVNAAWSTITPSSDRYVRVKFTGMASDTAIFHIALSEYTLLPYMESDHDDVNVTVRAKQLISSGGNYIGATQQNSMRSFDIAFGSVLPDEYINGLEPWVTECVETVKPWFFVPDTDQDVVYFGWQDSPGWSAPYRLGMYETQEFKFTTRGI